MFNQIVNAQGPEWAGKATASGAPDSSVAASTGPSEIDLTFKLTSLIKRRHEPVKNRLETFNESIWPQLQAYDTNLPPHISKLTNTFINAACKDAAKYNQPGVGLELVRLAVRLGITSLAVPNTMALSLCHALATGKNTSSSRNFLSQQLLELWMQVSQMQRLSEADQPLRLAVPASADFRKALKAAQNSEDELYTNVSVKPAVFLDSVFPQFGKGRAKELMDGLLATLSVFSDPRLVPMRVQREAAPLLHLAGIFATDYSQDADSMLHGLLSNSNNTFPADKATELADTIRKQWPTLVTFLTDTNQPWRQGNVGNRAAASLSTLHKRLRKAYQTRNRAGVQAIWMELYDGQVESAEIRDALQAKPDFMDFWIFVLCALRLTQEFKTTLEVMAQLRIPLTLKTYTSMLHGWRLCKDTSKIEKLWDQLVAAGVPLDAPIWTERLSAFIIQGQAQECIRTVAALQKKWEDAVATNTVEQTGAVQPGIEMINAIIKGLLDMDPQAARELLAWAHNHGIAPNVSTHNIILRKAFSTGPDDVAWVLDVMAKSGVEPDQATFVILIEEVLAMTGSDTPEQQVAAVNQVFADLARVRMRPSLEVYAKVLYGVASLADASDAAVDAVMAHLQHQNVRVNPYMVTILIERALLREPGSFAPVQALLKKYGMNELARGDQTLWERVIRAAAVTGRPDVALDMFDKLAAAELPVTSLPCLKELLVALLDKGRADEARRVVGAVLKNKMAAAAQKGAGTDMHDARYWRHHFWFVAKENQLLDYETMPSGLQRLIDGH